MLAGALTALLAVPICQHAQLGRSALADVRQTERPPHFKSGGERSEILLREILRVLQKLDERVERIEKSITSQAADRAPLEPPR